MVTTYNHERYIGQAIASVLNQTFGDFEVVVVNDGSTDRTEEVIRSFADPRLRHFHQPNQGPAVTANTALAACRGTYLAKLSGDDVLHPDRLRRQLAAYTHGSRRVLFSGVDFIDEDGRLLDGDFYPEVFKESNVSRAHLLERLFYWGPGFFGVTAFGELSVFRECGPYDPGLYQTHDQLRWIELLKRYEFEILPDRLYRFRIRAGGENLSGPQPDKQVRARNELYLVMKSFFRDLPTELFRQAFRSRLINPEFSSPAEEACEQAFLCLNAPAPLTQLIGIERLHQLLHDREAAEVLKRAYRFDFVRFAEMLRTRDITNFLPRSNSVVFVEQGNGWRPENMVRKPLDPNSAHFRVVFELGNFACPRIIAWAPSEEPWLGRVKVRHFRYRDATDVVHDLDPSGLSRHACSYLDGYHVFDGVDPRLLFFPSGQVKQLEVAGRLELLPPAETHSRLSRALVEQQATIEQLKQRLAAARPYSWWYQRARRGVGRLRSLFKKRR
jgi:glycosyltransferase involved in cell wall biosynthesis